MAVYHLSQVRNTFQYPLSKRVKTKARRFKPPNQNSFAFIICKNQPESRLETLILRQKCDDKRTHSYRYTAYKHVLIVKMSVNNITHRIIYSKLTDKNFVVFHRFVIFHVHPEIYHGGWFEIGHVTYRPD